MHSTKKAQLTLFIFIGILLSLIIVGTVYLTRTTTNGTTTDQTILTRTDMQPIQDYVESCLNIISDQALDLIGKQGFALFANQGGTYPSLDPNKNGTDYLYFEKTPVVFLASLNPQNLIYENNKLIISNSIHAQERFGDTSLLVYPWASFPVDPFTQQTTTYANSAWGWNKLPPLNNIGPNSIEAQLEGYLQTNMQKCVQFDRYPQFTITTNQPSAQVIFGQTNTIITLKWPITMTTAQGSRGILDTFLTSRSVRLATLHAFAKTIIDQDVSDITFNPYTNNTEIDMYIERNYTKGSIIRLVDKSSKLGDRPYEVRIARANRPPSLTYINQSTLTKNVVCEGATIDFNGQSLTISGNDAGCDINVNINLSATDPDEDPIQFSVSGPYTLPYTITGEDLASPFPCIPYKISAHDRDSQDWQQINIRLKSTQFAPTCAQ